jgi:hypothetical protein
MDVFVTNDKQPNFLFHNLGGGKFEEVGLESGVALPDHGKEISAMGTDFRDYNNDGLPDITIAALAGETFPLFRNEGKGQFRDASYMSKVGVLSNRLSGWSAAFVDLNNDGWKDLFFSGSHVNDTVEAYESTPYRVRNAVFANLGDGTFEDVSLKAGDEFQTPAAHRGAAFADFNHDGKVDVVVSSLAGRAELWQNEGGGDNTWLDVALTGAKSNRDGIGARVRVGTQQNHMTTAFGYASTSHTPVHFGTGKLREVDVEIVWPSGIRQTLKKVATNQIVAVKETKAE